MENQSQENTQQNQRNLNTRSGRVLGGVVLVVVGSLIFADRAGFDIPGWLFSWQTIVIAVGIYIGARRSFQPGGWLIPIAVGVVFLLNDWVIGWDSWREYFWPSIIIVIGIYMIIRPKRSQRKFWDSDTISSDETIDAVSIFGGTKRNIISKNFKGGEITTFFGGTDLNLTQADIVGTATLEITQAFGGTKLIVPAHWNIQSEVICVLGGINDKRPLSKDGQDANRLLVLRGTCVLGGIDIKSY